MHQRSCSWHWLHNSRHIFPALLSGALKVLALSGLWPVLAQLGSFPLDSCDTPLRVCSNLCQLLLRAGCLLHVSLHHLPVVVQLRLVSSNKSSHLAFHSLSFLAKPALVDQPHVLLLSGHGPELSLHRDTEILTLRLHLRLQLGSQSSH